MRPEVRPGTDFYRYINGRWLDETPIPADMSSWSEFAALGERTREQVHQLLVDGDKEDSMIGRFFASFMNETRVEELGLKPLEKALQRVRDIKDAAGFATFAGTTNSGFGRSPFSFGVGTDSEDPTMNIASLDQDGLGLPDRDYYLEPTFAEQREAYEKHVANMLQMIEWPDAEKAAARVLEFETAIAKTSWPMTALRDPIKTYNKMLVSDLPRRAPGFDWSAFMAAVGPIPATAEVVVGAFNKSGAADGVVGISKLVSETELSVLRSWSAFHLLSTAAGLLPKAFVEANFNFYGRLLNGQKEQKARWKLGVSEADSLLGDAVGREYVKRHFPESSREQLLHLTGLLKQAFRQRLHRLEWMSNKTKDKALEKLDSFTFEVGYPLKFRDYSDLELDRAELLHNAESAIRLEWHFQLSERGKPVDPNYWPMPPQTVNAFFEPTKNRCVFLAAILQPPFFDPAADAAVNFGAIGAVIGHEMTHGFDDEGRLYDASGRLREWWTPEDAERFSKLSEALGEQFGAFRLGLPKSSHINPQLTMGENIADLGGLTVALDAYHLHLHNHEYQPQPPLLFKADGLEGTRRLFAGWAQVWRGKATEESLRRQLVSDPHAPDHARGTVAPQNLDAWYQAFGVREGDGLFLDATKRVVIW